MTNKDFGIDSPKQKPRPLFLSKVFSAVFTRVRPLLEGSLYFFFIFHEINDQFTIQVTNMVNSDMKINVKCCKTWLLKLRLY